MAEAKKVATEINPWTDYVNVFVPKDSAQDEDEIFVSVNDHNFQIIKNMDVQVPRPVAAILRQRTAAIRVSEIVTKRAQSEFNKMP